MGPDNTRPTACPAADSFSPRTDWRRPAAAALVLCAICIAVFWPTLDTGFLPLDDSKYIQENPTVIGGITSGGIKSAFGLINNEFWLPALQLSYMADVELFGTGPRGFHLTNILLHAINSALFSIVLFMATRSLWPSLLGSALFALHPMRVEAVAWITARKDLLSGFFFLIATGAYLRYARSRGRSWLFLSAGALILGLTSKPILVIFPLLILVLDYWPLHRFVPAPLPLGNIWTRNRDLIVEKIPFFVLAAVFSALTLLTQRFFIHATENRFEWLDAAMRSSISPFIYLYETFWPLSLGVRFEGMENIFWKVVGFGTLAVAGHLVILVLLWRSRRSYPNLLAGWAWFLIALFPAGGIVPVGAQWISDRFTYIPHMGLFSAAAWLASDPRWTKQGRRAAVAVSIIAVFLCLVLSRTHTGYWADGVTLMKRSVSLSPDNAVAWRVYGDAINNSGKNLDAAVEAYQRALTLFPGFVEARNNLGDVLVKLKRTPEAIEQFEETLRQKPDSAEPHNNLGALLLDEGKTAEAISHFEQALRADPRHARAHNNLGNALMDTGRMADAIRHFREALRYQPDFAEAHNNLGAALYQQGMIPEAIDHLQSAVRLKEGYANAHNNLGLVLASVSRMPEAVAQFEEALKTTPGDAQIRNNLGNALRATGRLTEAVSHFEEALRLDPAYTDARNNLGMAMHDLGNLPEAIRQFQTAAQQRPDNPVIQVNLGDALSEAGKVTEAAACYERALALGYAGAGVRNNLGIVLLRMGKTSEAVAQLQKARESAPDDVGILMNLGNAMLDGGRPADAIDAFRRVLILAPDDKIARDRLERALEQLR